MGDTNREDKIKSLYISRNLGKHDQNMDGDNQHVLQRSGI